MSRRDASSLNANHPSARAASRPRRVATVLAVGALWIAFGAGHIGCILQNISPEERLRDAVVGYNDETRWNRLDLAQQRVTPMKRGEFRLRHYRWGRDIQIADLDILDVQVRGEDRDNATSIVQIRWYDQSTMLLADTVVAQEWERVTGGYILTAEDVREGDETLLEIPEQLLETADDDDADAADAEADEGSEAERADEGSESAA